MNHFQTEVAKMQPPPAQTAQFSTAYFLSPETLKSSEQYFEELLNEAYLDDDDLQRRDTFNESICNCKNIVAELANQAKHAKRTGLEQRTESDCMKVYSLLNQVLDAFFAL